MSTLAEKRGFGFNQSVQNVTDGGITSRFPSWLRLGVLMVLALLLAVFITDQIFNPGNFTITEIEVQGQFKNTDGKQVKGIVESAIDGNYFSINLEALENQIETLPWVYSASLRRRWPSTLLVEIEEVQPVAIWGGSRWLNFTGDLVSIPDSGQADQYADLPELNGPETKIVSVWNGFRHWSGQLASAGLSLDGLTLDSTGLWHLELSLGALALPQNTDQATSETAKVSSLPPQSSSVLMIVEQDFSTARIDRFIKTLNQHLITQFPYMKSIDLRYPNGFAIRWIDQAD